MSLSRYRTLDDVVGGLAALEAGFRQRGDRRGIFLTLYGVVSAEMRDRIARREFEDSEWVQRYMVAFANLYLDALNAYDDGPMDRVPKAWRLCFGAAAAGTSLVLQDMLLGVNAHVNHDLPLALSAVSIDPDRELRYRDHTAVNRVLAAVTELATGRISAAYAPGLATVADCSEVDEILSGFSLEAARESAWETAVSLANARNAIERGLVQRVTSARAAVLARLLLAPSANPRLIDACRRIEQGIPWMALLDEATTLHQALSRELT